MKVTVRLIQPEETIDHTEVKKTFFEDGWFCLEEHNETTYRYKADSIWLIVTDPIEVIEKGIN